MKVSVVTTLYLSEAYIKAFYSRIKQAVTQVSNEYEVIFVNDGSPDGSKEKVLQLLGDEPAIRLVDLSRNFGHHKAIMAGLMYATGDLIFQIDVDLEEEPEILLPFYKKMRETDADVVYGVQGKRKGSWLERVLGGLYYHIFNFLSDVRMPPNLLIARLMTRQYVDALLEHKEYELDLGGLWSITGFTQVPVVVRKLSKGTTSYTPRKRVALAVRSIAAFSNRPLILIATIGLAVLVLAFLYFVYISWVYFIVGKPPDGFTTLILSVWFLGGMILLSLGVIAVYLSIIFIETKKRPYVIVRRVYGGE